MKNLIKRIPIFGQLARRLSQHLRSSSRGFEGSDQYWKNRYESGGNSGSGSYEELATFKAEVLNAFVESRAITSVIEFGCGDGNQLKLAEYPSYLGFDISPKAIEWCLTEFRDDSTKSFKLMRDYSGETAELTLSLDVIYHLIEDTVFNEYMTRLFDSSGSFVGIYSSNKSTNPDNRPGHVLHRKFTDWITSNEPGWTQVEHIPNRHPFDETTGEGSFADFYFFEKDAN